jgi:hypothetical protein
MAYNYFKNKLSTLMFTKKEYEFSMLTIKLIVKINPPKPVPSQVGKG